MSLVALADGPDRLWLLVLALALDALVGDPDRLWRRLPHPVVLIGGAVGWLDRRLNHDDAADARRRAAGVVAVAILLAGALVVGWGVARMLGSVPGLWIGEILIVAVLLAQRSLYRHVAAVAVALETGGLEAGRQVVARIVGRDPASLDEAGVARAAIESCAESFSDGIVAPAFWYVVLGLPGLLAYKALNTADSMIGHRTPRYAAFGWAAARLDDAANLVPARLSALLLALAAAVCSGPKTAATALRTAWRDAPHHRSPNAGWPEAAMAGALDLALAGPRRYGSQVVDDAWMGDGRAEATARDIRAALKLFVLACCALAAGLAVVALV